MADDYAANIAALAGRAPSLLRMLPVKDEDMRNFLLLANKAANDPQIRALSGYVDTEIGGKRTRLYQNPDQSDPTKKAKKPTR